MFVFLFILIHIFQVVLKKLTELQTRNMIKCAATPTDMREKKIMDAFNNVNY